MRWWRLQGPNCSADQYYCCYLGRGIGDGYFGDGMFLHQKNCKTIHSVSTCIIDDCIHKNYVCNMPQQLVVMLRAQ